MLLLSLLAVLCHVTHAAPAFDKFKIDTAILHKMRQNESLLAATGVANDFVRRVSTTVAPHTVPEEFFDPHKAGNVQECEIVMAVLGVTLKDPVYRRRWQSLVYMGHKALLNALMKTTDQRFYIKDDMDMLDTIDGQYIWRRILLFVKNWNGTQDFYHFLQMLDMVPGDTIFKDVNMAQQFFVNARTTTSRLILPTSPQMIVPTEYDNGVVIPDI